MKKLIKTFLVALLLIPCMLGLVACGGGDDDGDDFGGGGSGGSGGNAAITTIFDGTTLPTNCKLVWVDERTDMTITFAKIGEECVYEMKYNDHASPFVKYYYKKTVAGYTEYMDMGSGFGGTSMTNQQAKTAFNSFSLTYLKPYVGTFATTENLTVDGSIISTKKYSSTSEGCTTIHWLHTNYNIVCKAQGSGYGQELNYFNNAMNLTTFNVNVTSFSNAGFTINV